MHDLFLVVMSTFGGTMGGWIMAQTAPWAVTEQTQVSLMVVVGAVGAAFSLGTILMGMKRDIRELKSTIQALPCHGEACPEPPKK